MSKQTFGQGMTNDRLATNRKVEKGVNNGLMVSGVVFLLASLVALVICPPVGIIGIIGSISVISKATKGDKQLAALDANDNINYIASTIRDKQENEKKLTDEEADMKEFKEYQAWKVMKK